MAKPALKKTFDPQILADIIFDLTDCNNFFVAFSGGLDSHVLLHALAKIRDANPHLNLQLTAIHINHNLSANSLSWAEHCQKICAMLNIPCLIKDIFVTKTDIVGKSLEEVARKLRYQAIAAFLPENSCLLTAHQQDDQAETLLLQLFRGAGVRGLAAMPVKTTFGKSLLIRPLLDFSRAALIEYATTNELKWIEDESNASINFDRNFLRLEIMPKLKMRWPGILQTLHRAATNAAEMTLLLDELAAADYLETKASGSRLVISKLLLLSPERQRNLIRYWLKKLHLALPAKTKLLQLQKDVLHARLDANPLVHWDGVEIRRYQGELYAMEPLPKILENLILPWDLTKPLKLPANLGTLIAKNISAATTAKIDLEKISVRFRNFGANCRLKKRTGTKQLKKLFQDWKIPTWQRDRIPLVFFGEEIAVIVGYGYCQNWPDEILIELEASGKNPNNTAN
ncbi:MAG: tRNA lysidine(34) synthetase TilS [Gammaproteobacteria bacterium]|nr:tRNA lysidine(34) synthetase TilS [Gammaproteobacteria bacterium]